MVSKAATNIFVMGFHKSTLVARSADTQLDLRPSCLLAPQGQATNVDLFACFAERMFRSFSISC